MKVSNLLIDIREFSIAVNVPLVNVVERMSARKIRATAHMPSFTSGRTVENCLMSARNIRATAHAPRSQDHLRTKIVRKSALFLNIVSNRACFT